MNRLSHAAINAKYAKPLTTTKRAGNCRDLFAIFDVHQHGKQEHKNPHRQGLNPSINPMSSVNAGNPKSRTRT